jgi:hypothetical protein
LETWPFSALLGQQVALLQEALFNHEGKPARYLQ